MKILWTLALAALLPGIAPASDVYRIEVGKDYKSYSDSDLRRRVWELERAVDQLQVRIFQLEGKAPTPVPTSDSWLCSVSAMGTTYTGTGGSKAVAKDRALTNCKASQRGDGFFCESVTCEQ